jgi:hypothetical protein
MVCGTEHVAARGVWNSNSNPHECVFYSKEFPSACDFLHYGVQMLRFAERTRSSCVIVAVGPIVQNKRSDQSLQIDLSDERFAVCENKSTCNMNEAHGMCLEHAYKERRPRSGWLALSKYFWSQSITDKGVQRYQKAEETGHPEAQNALGQTYQGELPSGVKHRSPGKEATKWGESRPIKSFPMG